jgi:hypothetical protein
MNSRKKDSAQRMLAMIVIIAMLAVMGIPVSVVVFFAIVTYFIWRFARRAEHYQTRCIFEFYIAANDILRDENRHWFGFEVSEVIEDGERVLHIMPDPPPLVYFTLGVLYHHVGDYDASVEHLSYIIENDLSDERHRVAPSPELRRYVQILRKLEREPAEAPQTITAIRNLERTRRNFGPALLDASRQRINIVPTLAPKVQTRIQMGDMSHGRISESVEASVRSQNVLAPPPPIADVLRDVYDEEKKTA